MLDSHSDLLILGAGPAGCAAAITGLAAGARVTILERRNPPRLQPGETLHPGVEPLLRQLGIWDALVRQGFHRHQGIWREGVNGDRSFTPYGQDETGAWYGFQVHRTTLNRLLQSRVIDLGGTIKRAPRLALVRNADGMSVTSDGIAYQAAAILDATGRHAWMARELGLTYESDQKSQRLWFGWKTCKVRSLQGQPLFVERSDGWDWWCPLGHQQHSWVRLRNGPANGGIDYTNGIYPECAGEGYMLLGDAAFLLDPSFANGVLRALMSGIFSATLCREVRLRRIRWDEAVEQYRSWIRRFYDSAFETVRAAQRYRLQIQREATPADAGQLFRAPREGVSAATS